MKLHIDTALYLTDSQSIGLYTSADNFECAVDERTIVDMVDEYCKLFELPRDPYVISGDCFDLVVKLKQELKKALDTVELYVDGTTRDMAKYTEEDK